VRRVLAALLVASLAAPAARAAEVTPRQRALLLLRVLVYDRTLAQRAGGEVTVGLLYRPGHPESELERRALLDAYQSLAGQVTAGGRAVRAVELPYAGAADLEARLGALRPAAIFACAGLDDAAAEVAAAARRARVLAFAGTRAAVAAGVPVGLIDRGERAGVLLDPAAAAAAGADLDSALLSVAELAGHRGAARPRPR